MGSVCKKNINEILAKVFYSYCCILLDLDDSWVDTDDASLTLLQNLKVTQPEKYRKLRERFVTPLTAPAAQQDRQATFEKAELFFKTFIDVCVC